VGKGARKRGTCPTNLEAVIGRGAVCPFTIDNLQGRWRLEAEQRKKTGRGCKKRLDMDLKDMRRLFYYQAPPSYLPGVSPRQRARPATFPDRHEPPKKARHSALRKDPRPLALQTVERTMQTDPSPSNYTPPLSIINIYRIFYAC
jgi:hypothetical protein